MLAPRARIPKGLGGAGRGALPLTPRPQLWAQGVFAAPNANAKVGVKASVKGEEGVQGGS